MGVIIPPSKEDFSIRAFSDLFLHFEVLPYAIFNNACFYRIMPLLQLITFFHVLFQLLLLFFL